MALDTFDNLKASIESWSHRNDIDLFADDCIALCESEMYTGTNPLAVKELEGLYTASVTAQESSLPDGFIRFRDVRILYSGEYFQMKYLPPASMPDYSTTGTPIYYTVTNSLTFDRVPDQAYTIKARYYSRATALSDSNTTNTILTNYPNIYLFGSVAAAFFYAGEEEKALLWGDRFQKAIAAANQASDIAQLGANPTIQVDGCIP